MKIEDELAGLNGNKTLLALSSVADLQTSIGKTLEYLIKNSTCLAAIPCFSQTFG
jgi:hypothetical protein